jgi:hypothetical protein
MLGMVLLSAAASVTARAQVPPELIEEALDQPIQRVEIENVPLPQALAQLEQRTGLRFAVDPAVLELMPYGPRTPVSIQISDMSVRQGLSRTLAGLGLEMIVRPDAVALVPIPAVQRMGRRMTAAEVGLLARLASAPWSGLRDVPAEFRIDPQAQPRQALERAVGQMHAPTAVDQLEAATRTLGWVWRPEGERIVFMTRRDEVRCRLDRPVDLSYQRRPLDEVLVDLGRRAGVTMLFEPGSLRQVDARERAVDLVQRDVSVRQTIERICGNTGLGYEIVDDGVRITAPVAASQPAVEREQAAARRWIKIGVQVRPGVTIDALVPVEQLPADVREEVERRLHEVLSPLRSATPPGP